MKCELCQEAPSVGTQKTNQGRAIAVCERCAAPGQPVVPPEAVAMAALVPALVVGFTFPPVWATFWITLALALVGLVVGGVFIVRGSHV